MAGPWEQYQGQEKGPWSQYSSVSTEPEVKPDTGFTGAAKSSYEMLKGEAALLAGKTGIMGLEEAEKYYLGQQEKARKAFKPTEEGWTEAPLTKFKELLGGSVPYMAAPIAAGAAAAALPVTGVAGTVLALGAAGAASATQFTGSNLSRQMDTGKSLAQTDLLNAGATAIPQAALDTLSFKLMPGIGRIFSQAGVKISDDVAQEVAKKGIAATAGEYALSGAKIAGIEGGTEAAQQFFERLQAGLNIADEEARKEYFESFVGGAVLGGTVGVGGRAYERAFPRKVGETDLTKSTLQEKPLTTPTTLALPSPEEIILNEREYDPLKNPIGNFSSDELTPDQIKYIDTDRKANGKPKLKSYSLEDLVDAVNHSDETAAAKQGIIDNLLTVKTGYTGEVELTPDDIYNVSRQKNVETKTQGFNDFLRRATGSEDVMNMSQPQLFSAFEALSKLDTSPELMILPEGTNAVRFSEKQYENALRGLESVYDEFGTSSLGRTSVIQEIKDFAGLERDADAEALYRQALRRNDLEENLREVKTTEGTKTVPEVSFAGKVEPLPSGFDIRYQSFKQGVEPESYEVKNGSVVIQKVKTAEEAQKVLDKQTKINERLVKPPEAEIAKIEKAIANRNNALDIQRAKGFGNTLGFRKLAAEMDARNKVDEKSIEVHRTDIQNFTNPLKIEPVGEKPITQKKYVFYEGDKPLASFGDKYQAEEFGIMKLDEGILGQIIETGPKTKGVLPKRYAAFAAKEMQRRRGELPKGIEVKKSIYTEKVDENLDKLRQQLLPTLKRFGLEKVGLRIVNSIADGKADGSYVQALIKIAVDAKNPMGTLRHESIHALKELGAFTPEEWKVLTNKAKSEWIGKYIKPNMLNAYREQYLAENKNLKGFDEYIQEEAIAEAFADFANTKPPAGIIGNIFFRLNNFFEALGNTFKRLGFKTAADVFKKVERGEAKPTKIAAVEKEKLSRRQEPVSEEEYFAKEAAKPKAKKVIFEVAPDPNNKDLTERWNSLAPEQKLTISKKVADYVVKNALETFDTTGKVADQVGSYGEFTNPSLSLFVDSGDAVGIAKYLGFALSQDSMVVISPRETKGLDKTGAVIVDVGNKTEKEIDDIYQTLHAIRLNDENPVGGQSTINGKMVVLNYSNSTTPDLAKAIDDALKQKYNVAVGEVYTAFPEKKDYDYGDKANDPRGIGRVIRERSRAVRNEATTLLEAELRKSGKGKAESSSSAINLLDKRIDNPNLKKPTVNDVGKYFDGLYAEPLDFNNAEDFERAVKIAKEEVAYQLENERSGLDWYDQDVSKAFKETAKIIPELKKEKNQFLFSVMAGIMSPQTNPRDNWVIAAQNFQNYVKTGKISGVNPENGKLWQGGTQSINKRIQLDFLNNMIQDMGEKRTIDWLKESHTVKEINNFRQKYGNISSGIGGKMNDVVPALYAFGPKVGPFVSNINGIHDVTVDKWMTRTFNRYFGTMIKDGEIVDVPTEQQRSAVKKLINEVAKDANIKPYQAQSLLWFFEQRVFRELGTPSPSYGFADGARKFSEQNKPRGDRGGDEGTGTDKSPTGERLQIRAPETKEFKQWFGDSKVVNPDGSPRVMYHGTLSDFSEFAPKTANAIFVTPDKESANRFATNFKKRKGAQSNVMPVYVKAKNPFDYENPEHIEKVVDSLPAKDKYELLAKHNFKFTHKFKESIGKGMWKYIESPAFQKAIQNSGFDGFYIKEANIKNLAVYNPNQIKSVFNQKPTESKDVRYSLRDTVDPSIWGSVDRTTTKREEKGFIQRLLSSIFPDSAADFRFKYINALEGIERQTTKKGEMFGEKELLAENSALAAALQSMRAAGVAASSFRDGIPVYDKGYTYVTDNDGKNKGLIPIFEPLAKYGDAEIYRLFQFYAATRRGKRLMADGRERLFTPDDITKGDALEKQFPEFKTVFNEYQIYNKGLVDYMKATGVISDAEAKIWTQNWDYIPFYRQLDGESTAGPKVFSSLSGVSKPKKLKGGEEELADFMETIVRNSRAAIEAGMKNEAARRAVRDAKALGTAQELTESETGNDIVNIKENGKTKYYRVDDPLLVKSMQALNMPQLELISFLGKPAELLRNFVTKDPGFILANLGRDSLQAWITSGTKMRPVVDTFQEFGNTLFKQSPVANALARAGMTGYDFAGDVKSTSEQVMKELRKRGDARTTGEKALLPITALWDALEQGSHASDMATRVAIYKQTLERTGSEAEAMYQAMEVLNFSRRGASPTIRMLAAMIPFLNARIQGLDVLYRSGWGKMATENKDVMKKAFAVRALTMMGMSMLYWFLVSDTEEYERLTKEERDNYWIVPGVELNGKPFRFPIPFELGVVFKVIPERVLETAFGSDTGKDLKESMFRQLTGTLGVSPPQAFLPILENLTNYSLFTGEPLVGRGLQDLEPKYQFTSGTSQMSKDLGAQLNISPIKIENLVRGYTGTLGTYAVQALDAIYRGEGDPVKATMRTEQMPVIKRFFATDSGTVAAYYDLKEEVDTAVRTVNFLERTGDMEGMREYLEGKGRVYLLKDYIRSLENDMKQIREARRVINESKDKPADEKREYLDRLHDMEIQLTQNIRAIRKQN